MYVYHFTGADLKRRGWTDSLIKEFVPTPHTTTPNPWYRSAPPIRLYEKNKIAAIECSPEWKKAASAVRQRKEAAAKAVQTKLGKLNKQIEEWNPSIPQIEMTELIERACRSYNSHKLDLLIERGYDYTPATPDSDEDFLHRITVNYLRHNLTSYERKLRRQYGRVGVREAYLLISRKVCTAISEAYPELADECKRQLREREAAGIYERG